jgi:hypothetical protein
MRRQRLTSGRTGIGCVVAIASVVAALVAGSTFQISASADSAAIGTQTVIIKT